MASKFTILEKMNDLTHVGLNLLYGPLHLDRLRCVDLKVERKGDKWQLQASADLFARKPNMSLNLTAEQVAELRVAFEGFDPDETGYITKDDIGFVLKSLGNHLNYH